jgi:uncharacterized protein YukE
MSMTPEASLEEMDLLSGTFRDQAGIVAAVRSAVSGRMGDTRWTGLAADAFRDRWSQEYEPVLHRLEEELGRLGTYVSRKRDEFDQACNAL